MDIVHRHLADDITTFANIYVQLWRLKTQKRACTPRAVVVARCSQTYAKNLQRYGYLKVFHKISANIHTKHTYTYILFILIFSFQINISQISGHRKEDTKFTFITSKCVDSQTANNKGLRHNKKQFS